MFHLPHHICKQRYGCFINAMNQRFQSQQRVAQRACVTSSRRHPYYYHASPNCPAPRRRVVPSPSYALHRSAAHGRRFKSTVSEAEVKKFAALSDSWWNPLKNPLIAMNVIRMQFVQDAASRHLQRDSETDVHPLQNLRVLDIGCGGGLLSVSLARLGADTTGIDPSDALIAAAKKHAVTHLSHTDASRLLYTRSTVEEYSAQNKAQELFDMVCCLEVIEHVPDPVSLLRTASQMLKPGGLLFVSTINRTAKSFALTIVGAEYIMGFLPVGTHQWHSYKSPYEVKQLLRGTDLQPVETAGMVIAPSSLPAVLTRNVWDWQLDPTDTDVNWIGCYQMKAA